MFGPLRGNKNMKMIDIETLISEINAKERKNI